MDRELACLFEPAESTKLVVLRLLALAWIPSCERRTSNEHNCSFCRPFCHKWTRRPSLLSIGSPGLQAQSSSAVCRAFCEGSALAVNATFNHQHGQSVLQQLRAVGVGGGGGAWQRGPFSRRLEEVSAAVDGRRFDFDVEMTGDELGNKVHRGLALDKTS